MKKPLAVIGLFLLLAPLATNAAMPSIYEQIEGMVSQESESPAEDIGWFVAQTLNKADLWYLQSKDPLSLTQSDVETALKGDVTGFCTAVKLNQYYPCPLLINDIKLLAEREENIVRLGRRLQAIATSYEQPITAFSLQPGLLSSSYLDILRVWGLPDAGTGTVRLGRSVRLLPVPEEEAGDAILEAEVSIRADIGAVSDPNSAALVWRYQYGVDFVENGSDEENPDGASGPDTERKLLFKRNKELEAHLKELIDAVKPSITPPLREGEIGLLRLAPKDDSNVVIWAYVRDERGDDPAMANLPAADAGLQWSIALEPVRPALDGDDGEPIPAGRYPPAPAQEKDQTWEEGGGGLCWSLSGSEGYLCRERDADGGENPCEEKPLDPKTDTIILSPCTPKGEATDEETLPKDEEDSEEEDQTTKDVCSVLRKRAVEAQSSSVEAEEENATEAQGDTPPPQCEPGKGSAYPYTVLGNACLIHDCAARTGSGRSILPGMEPLVSQESVSPWGECLTLPPEEKPLNISPFTDPPRIPPYNPAERIRALNIQYCQGNAKPPLLPPSLCEPSLAMSIEKLQVVSADTALKLTQQNDSLVSNDLLQQAEGRGLDEGTALYKDYLHQASLSVQATLQTTVDFLKKITSTTFPELLCPLNPSEATTLCKEFHSSSSTSSQQPLPNPINIEPVQ